MTQKRTSRLAFPSRANTARRSSRGTSRRLMFESLEGRRLLTSMLYVDFGDRFPVAGLTGTIGTLKTATSGVAGDPAVAGPDMDGSTNGDWDVGNDGMNANDMDDADGFNLISFVDRYTADGGAYPGGLAQLRADVMSFVRRFYEPFDITVVELTATAINVNGRMVQAADDLADISSTLGANEAGVAKNNDGYVLLGAMTVHRPAAAGGDFDPGTMFGGYASVIDMPNSNNNDNTAVCYLTPGDLSGAPNDGFFGNLIAHEAGHLFGLQHSLTQAPGGAVSPLIPTSEIMSYLGGNGFNFFSRYPQVRGNNNTMNNDDLQAVSPPAPAAQRTPHDQWLNTASIGQNTAFHYVTGTGANDIITITNAGGGNATVSVQAFSNNTYTTALAVPGSGGASTTYTYTLALDRPFTIDGGDLNDRIILDADLGVTLNARGMSGTDELIVMGKNAASGTYTPGTNNVNGLDGNADIRGSVVVGATTLNFQEFEAASRVTVRDLASLTLRTPLSDDSLALVSAAAGQNRITGSSGGVGIVPLTFFNVGAMTIDTGANDGALPNDTVTINSAIVASGLQNLTVTTGAGADLLQTTLTSYALPVPGGTFSYLAGTQSDEIEATADVSFNLSDTSLGIDGDGSIVMLGVNEADLTGGASANTFTVSNWSGTADLDGAGAGDSYVINFKGADGGTVDVADTGASGMDTVAVNATTGDNVLSVTSSQVVLGGETAGYQGVESLTVNAGAGDDTINIRSTLATTPAIVNGDNDDDSINVGNLANSLDDIQGTLTVNGNDPAASDTLNVNDQGDADPHAYVITETTVDRDGAATITYATVESLTVNGGSGGNEINIQSTASTTPVTINAGAGDDDVTVDSDGGPIDPPSGTVDLIVSSLTINGQAGANTLRLEDFSDPSDVTGDIVHVTPTQIGADPGDRFFGTGGSLTYSDLAHITLDLSNGYFPDTVYLIPSATTAFELHGNDPDCPMNPDQLPGDALYVDFTGVTDPLLVADGAGHATWTFSNREDVAFDGFEKLNHVGIIVLAPDTGGGPPLVRVFDAETGAEKLSFLAFDANYHGGVRVAVGDVNCDAIPDIITAAGPGRATEVRVFNGVTGLPFAGPLGSFQAYDHGSKSGVWVAAGDINQDGTTDIVTGTDNGADPIVKVFDGHTGGMLHQFQAYDTNFRTGVRVAVGDISGDGVPDIVTVPGQGKQSLVRVFDGTNPTLPPLASFLAFDSNYHHGVYLAVGDVNGDGRADVVTGGGAGGQRLVRVYDGNNLAQPPLASFQPHQSNGADSIRVASVDIDGDGDFEVVTAHQSSRRNSPAVFDLEPAPSEIDDFFATETDFRGGYFVAAGG